MSAAVGLQQKGTCRLPVKLHCAEDAGPKMQVPFLGLLLIILSFFIMFLEKKTIDMDDEIRTELVKC